jgi:hypothetical protein
MFCMDVPSPNTIYARALAEAKQELLALCLQVEAMMRRKEQLEAVIANLTPLLPEPKSDPTLNFPEGEIPAIAVPLPPQPIWKSIVQAMNGKNDAFTVKDALQALERIGRPIESPNRFQIARAVLTKKTQNFKQIGPGLFALVDHDETEVSPEEKNS